MTVTVKLLLIAALMLSIVIPFGTFLLGEKSKKRYKRTIGANAFFFFKGYQGSTFLFRRAYGLKRFSDYCVVVILIT